MVISTEKSTLGHQHDESPQGWAARMQSPHDRRKYKHVSEILRTEISICNLQVSLVPELLLDGKACAPLWPGYRHGHHPPRTDGLGWFCVF